MVCDSVADCEANDGAKATGQGSSAWRAPLGSLCIDKSLAMNMLLGQHRGLLGIPYLRVFWVFWSAFFFFFPTRREAELDGVSMFSICGFVLMEPFWQLNPWGGGSALQAVTGGST